MPETGDHDGVKRAITIGRSTHPLAAKTLLESISLLYQTRVRVVLSADCEAISLGLGLTDGFGFGIDSLYYEVEVLPDAEQRRRAKRLLGLGDFRDVRRLVSS